jgi:outer membrane protein assembly factor BamB
VTPAAVGDRVFFGAENGTFLCVDWRKEELAWTFKTNGLNPSAVARRPPTRRWYSEAAIAASGRWIRNRQAVVAVLGSSAGRFVARDRRSAGLCRRGRRPHPRFGSGHGEELWQYETGNSFTGSPAVASGRLVIADERGTIYCFGAAASE